MLPAVREQTSSELKALIGLLKRFLNGIASPQHIERYSREVVQNGRFCRPEGRGQEEEENKGFFQASSSSQGGK